MSNPDTELLRGWEAEIEAKKGSKVRDTTQNSYMCIYYKDGLYKDSLGVTRNDIMFKDTWNKAVWEIVESYDNSSPAQTDGELYMQSYERQFFAETKDSNLDNNSCNCGQKYTGYRHSSWCADSPQERDRVAGEMFWDRLRDDFEC